MEEGIWHHECRQCGRTYLAPINGSGEEFEHIKECMTPKQATLVAVARMVKQAGGWTLPETFRSFFYKLTPVNDEARERYEKIAVEDKEIMDNPMFFIKDFEKMPEFTQWWNRELRICEEAYARFASEGMGEPA